MVAISSHRLLREISHSGHQREHFGAIGRSLVPFGLSVAATNVRQCDWLRRVSRLPYLAPALAVLFLRRLRRWEGHRQHDNDTKERQLARIVPYSIFPLPGDAHAVGIIRYHHLTHITH